MKRVIETLEIAKKAQEKDCDSVFVVVGRERSGKSHLTLNCDDYLGAEDKSIVVDKFKLGECLGTLNDCDVFHYDEAADGLFTKDAMNKWNKELEKLFMIIGQKRLISFLLIPDFFMLSPYFRKHRIVGLFWVYARGKVAFYDRHGVEKINYNHDRNKNSKINGGRPLYYDTFPIYNGRLMPGYKIKKDDKVKSLIGTFTTNTEVKPAPQKQPLKKDLVIDYMKQGWKPVEIARELKMNLNYVREVVSSNK